MKIEIKQGYKFTAPVIRALQEATNIEINEVYKNDKKVYFTPAGELKGNKEVGQWMLAQINEWMLLAGIVDIKPLEECKYQTHFNPFCFIK